MPTLAELRATAYHEAGHAVAALMLGRGFRSVSVIPNDESLGRVVRYPLWADGADAIHLEMTPARRSRPIPDERVFDSLRG